MRTFTDGRLGWALVLGLGLVGAGCGKPEDSAARPAVPAAVEAPSPTPEARRAPSEPVVAEAAAGGRPAAAPGSPELQRPVAPPPPPLPVASAPPAGVSEPGRVPALNTALDVLERASKLAVREALPELTPSASASVKAPVVATGTGAKDLLSQDRIAVGLREALAVGLRAAVSELGKEGGFLSNPGLRIAVPESLSRVENAARALGQSKRVDEFVTAMNRAAEQAVPGAAAVFTEALTQMSIEDARGILQGPPDAATQYFRRTTEARLAEKFLPVVREATAKAGVTAAYKQLTAGGAVATSLLGSEKPQAPDLDRYVTLRAMDGLFSVLAAQEKQIREMPAARTTEVLKSVFEALRR